MSPMVDTSYHVRAGSDGTLDDSYNCVISQEIYGTGLKGMCLYVWVPSAATGCVPTLTISVHASTTSAAATTDELIAQRVITDATGLGREYTLPVFTTKRSVAFAFDVSGGSTPVFSNVDAWLVQNVGERWNRSPEWI